MVKFPFVVRNSARKLSGAAFPSGRSLGRTARGRGADAPSVERPKSAKSASGAARIFVNRMGCPRLRLGHQEVVHGHPSTDPEFSQVITALSQVPLNFDDENPA